MNRFRKLRLRLRVRDEGVAMVMVIGVGSVLTLLMVAAVAVSVGSSRKATADDDWNAALAAAYAGVEEYQARLSDEPAYVKYGNPSSTFSNPSGSATSTVQLPATLNPAFGLGATGTWVPVPGSTQSSFRYEVDNSTYSATGTIRVRSTGKVGTRVRSITADLRQKGFIDFLYFTDYEMSDPAVVGGDCAVKYRWGPDPRSASCTIQFSPTDKIGGPVHSNDTILTCGRTEFLGQVTTGNPAGGYNNGGCAAAKFEYGEPQYSPVVGLPATNTELKKETRSDLVNQDVPRPGCLYTGPTRITFLDNGKMNVKSPWTKFTTVKGDPATSGDAGSDTRCGSPAALRSADGVDITVPKNNVVYVQNIPLTGVNSATLAQTTSSDRNNKRCLSTSGTKLSINDNSYSQNVVGYPVTNEVPPQSGVESDDSYGCRNGDLFVSGRLSGGAVTMAAENYVYVTGDTTYKSADDDMLGLIGQNAVWVHNPIKSDNTFITGANRTVSAAILSVQHTFIVQNYTKGSTGRGTLTVNGAIAQKFRGPVGVSNGTGFQTKKYVYDTRFRYTAPPKFLSPVTTTYGVNVWVETAPAFKTDGTYQ